MTVDGDGVKPRIIVVDDDSDCLEVVTAVLKGYEVLALTDGDRLVARAQDFRPDIVVLDINLKDSDGFTLCRDLKGRRATSHIPVVFLSGLMGSTDFLGAFRAGGTVYLTKPVDPAELRRTVETVLHELKRGGSGSE